MHFTKIILGIATGAVFTGITLAIVAYFAAINDHSSSLLGSASEWWFLAMIGGFVGGIIIGGISGTFITGFNLNFIKAAAFSGLFNCLIIVVFYVFIESDLENGIKYTLYSLFPIGIVNGVIVVLLNLPQQSLK